MLYNMLDDILHPALAEKWFCEINQSLVNTKV